MVLIPRQDHRHPGSRRGAPGSCVRLHCACVMGLLPLPTLVLTVSLVSARLAPALPSHDPPHAHPFRHVRTPAEPPLHSPSRTFGLARRPCAMALSCAGAGAGGCWSSPPRTQTFLLHMSGDLSISPAPSAYPPNPTQLDVTTIADAPDGSDTTAPHNAHSPKTSKPGGVRHAPPFAGHPFVPAFPQPHHALRLFLTLPDSHHQPATAASPPHVVRQDSIFKPN